MPSYTLGNSKAKPKAQGAHTWTDQVAIPTWLTRSESFETSLLQDLLFTKPGSSESFLNVRADPLAINSASMLRHITDVTRGWLEENLVELEELNPEHYLFEIGAVERVPDRWLEDLFALPVHEHHGLVMDADEDQ